MKHPRIPRIIEPTVDRLIKSIDPYYVRDFVMFKSGKLKWVIDGGEELSPEEERFIYVKIVDDAQQLTAFYTDLINSLHENYIYKGGE